MAPILSTAVGVNPQIIDDPRLQKLLGKLNEFEPKGLYQQKQYQSSDEVVAPLDNIEQLVAAIEPFQTWIFEEQVDLHEWINTLNAIDACLGYFIQKHPSLLLIGPVKRKRGRGTVDSQTQFVSCPAESEQDVANVSSNVLLSVTTFLRFLCSLLRNSSSKSVFNSVEELVDLLSAADDTVASLALEALCNLATPPCLHKQQSPEVNQHTTLLHSSKTASHRRLVALARGWGTRGSGLGLFTCVTTDDSEFGQGLLPAQAGELDFSFSTNKIESSAEDKPRDAASSPVDNSDYELVRIHLSTNEILNDSTQASNEEDADMTNLEEDAAEASNKRRRVGPVHSGAKTTKSTAELFFTCLEKAGGRSKLQDDRLFALLADIRLAKSFYNAASRVDAVERRLRALIAILQSHPSHEIMSGYFQAQPELCVELIDLLRPTVSSANVSAASSKSTSAVSSTSQDALGTLASSPGVPYSIRMLAIESLTALVGRRDGTTGALTGAARHSSVLTELGVGKGQYLGLLPTLIRYSLASLGSSFAAAEQAAAAQGDAEAPGGGGINNDALDIGLAFVEAARAPEAPRLIQLERALEFVDAVLTLTSAIVSTPTGTSALTDCGLIPALLTTAATDSRTFLNTSLPNAGSYSSDKLLRVRSLLRFITAQAIQILEGAIVTHNNALSAFHDLQGVEVLTSRLSKEVSHTRSKSVVVAAAHSAEGIESMDCDTLKPSSSEDMDIEMETETEEESPPQQRILSSQRVLLFSIVTCLTVVFHQESTQSSAAAPSGGAQLRKPELTSALIEIMDDVSSYGGHLASLIATLLSDVLNGDPHVVRHVHESGIAKSFLNMLIGKRSTDASGVEEYEPILPPVPELIMALPNVISALALTEDGAKAVQEANPFPAMLRLFRHPNYAMPYSRCLLNEMTAIVGTGLDEVMRHVQLLKPLVVSAIADALNRIVGVADDLMKREEARFDGKNMAGKAATELENERSCLMQYVLNFGQLLEQILHNEDHCEPFVTAGGLDALLKLFPAVMPTGYQFLSHVSSLSCPAVSTLHHSTAEESLCLAFKCISLRYDQQKLIKTTLDTVKLHVMDLEETQTALRQITSAPADDADIVRIDAAFVLEGLPFQPLHHLCPNDDKSVLTTLSKYLRAVSNVQWATSLLGIAIKTSCQRAQDSGTGWGRQEREWKKELSAPAFEELVGKLSIFHQSAIFEVCRIRSTDGFAQRERERLSTMLDKKETMRYRLRIVCPEGAVVRDGIEIDSCASVGSMEMGEIAEAFDRCVNSSGILRYRTRRGWVSEMTRGHGREPVAEVMAFWQHDSNELPEGASPSPRSKKRIEAPIPDLCSVSGSVLARVQTSYAELFNALSKSVVLGVRSLTTPFSFKEGGAGEHAATMMRILSSNVQQGLARGKENQVSTIVNSQGIAMYLGCMISHLHACLFEEKRERRMVNVPLMLFLMETDADSENNADQQGAVTLPNAIRFIFDQSLSDFANRSQFQGQPGAKTGMPVQRTDRTVAASLPAALSLLRRLMSGTLISSSPASSILSRIKRSDLALLLGRSINGSGFKETDDDEALFSPEDFVKRMHFTVSEVVRETWVDPRFVYSPPNIIHPFATLVSDIVSGLEDAGKKRSSQRTPRLAADTSTQWDLFQGAAPAPAVPAPTVEEVFEPSEESIARLEEMGFNRDHAIDALENARSNRVEIAMEYALSHPPPSAAVIERRRVQREERQQQRDAAAAAGGASETATGDVDGGAEAGEAVVGVENGETDATAVTAAAAAAPSESNENKASSEAMDVEQENDSEKKDEESKDKEKEKEASEKKEEAKEDYDVTRAKALLKEWIKDAPRVSCSVLDSLTDTLAREVDTTISPSDRSGTVQGDGEGEALAVVLSSFLLDLCQRYPEQCDTIVAEVLKILKAQLEGGPDGGFRVRTGKDRCFATLCQAAVLFTRALPKTRTIILKENMVHMIVSCVQGSLKRMDASASPNSIEGWPVWLASAILILDVMAQPVIAFSEAKKPEDDEEVDDGSEFSRVRQDHKTQAAELTSMAAKLFSTVEKGPVEVTGESNKNGSKDNAAEVPGKAAEVDTTEDRTKENTVDATKKDAADEKPAKKTTDEIFSSIPAFFPLLPSDAVRSCMEMCLDVLRRGRGSDDDDKTPPLPGVVHATMLLLLRLLRTPKMAAQCLQMGAAETILSLSKKCRFTGNSGLVTLILRRLLEDEATLQAALETEIRGTIAKLNGKRRETDAEPMSVPHDLFAEATAPLLCRDPISFLKAFLITVKVEVKVEIKVKLLSAEERTQNQKSLAEVIKTNKEKHSAAAAGGLPSGSGKASTRRRSTSLPRQKKGAATPTAKTKGTPQRHSSSKRNHSTKKQKRDEKQQSAHAHHASQSHGSPANHIVSLLISNIISSCGTSSSTENLGRIDHFPDDKSFLWTANLLEILADLVLAVPACAAAVQKFRPQRAKDRSLKNGVSDSIGHALDGCPSPPKTFLSFLLHAILPQDRWSIRNDQQLWERAKDEVSEDSEPFIAKKKMAFRVNKVSQSAARLLVALVARPGEGRKRVISELTFALSGGNLGHASTLAVSTHPPSKSITGSAKELHALQAWGELCIGLASPRSNGKNPEGNSSLSFEVIKLMLELGMAHSLLYSIHRVRLHHPMAASTCSSLLLPFEVLTRGSVADGIKALVEKEDAARLSKTSENSKKQSGVSTSAVSNDDGMLEEAFHQEAPPVRPVALDLGDDEESEEDGDIEMEGQLDEGSAADEEVTSSSESDESNDDSEDEGSGNDDDDEDDEGSIIDDDDEEDDDSSESSADEMEEAVDGGDWNMNYRNELNDGFDDDDGGEENEPDQEDEGLDEGWTRVDNAGGFAAPGMAAHQRLGLAPNQGPLTARTRGFIDAAEAMIGTLLRTGEIHGDALAEIEGSLGIRIMANGRSLRTLGGAEGGAENVFAESIAARLGGPAGAENRQPNSSSESEAVGTLPHVHQRTQPGSGYSSLSGGGRWIETSSMEYVFGGPSVTAGSRNYDLISPVQEETELLPNMSQLDLQLFPGGPASAAHARTQHSLHPLLCGVDLPPVNALVSDLLPHGIRCTRQGLMTTRRPGEWSASSFSSGNCLVITSNGNVIRSNRSHAGAPLSQLAPSRNVAGPIGFSDDLLPFDATALQFNRSFEDVLRDSAVTLNIAREEAQAAEEAATAAAATSVPEASDPTGGDEENEAMDTAEDAEDSPDGVEGAGAEAIGQVENQVGESVEVTSNVNAGNENALTDSRERNASIDGDGVASSLAEGLRLSPRDETTTDPMALSETVEAPAAAPTADAPMEEAADTEGTTANESAAMYVQPAVGDITENEGEEVGQAVDATAEAANNEAGGSQERQPNSNGLVCPPEIDEEVFNSLPEDMQRDCIEQHRATQELASQLDAGSSLDPDALAALPEDIRREVIAQEAQERRLREAPAADPSHAEEMDNASFLVSLTPELREEILLTADETFLNSLPAGIIAEAQILRERVNNAQQRRQFEEQVVQNRDLANAGNAPAVQGQNQAAAAAEAGAASSARRKARSGKLRVDRDRDEVVYIPSSSGLTQPISESDVKGLLQLLYLLAPVRPARLLQKVFQNFCSQPGLRSVVSAVFVKLLHEDEPGARAALNSMAQEYTNEEGGWRKRMDIMCADTMFPPRHLLGAVPEVLDTESFNPNITLMRRKQGSSTAAAIAANLPTSLAGSRSEQQLPPVVATRVVESLMHLCKNSPKFCLHSLVTDVDRIGLSKEDSIVATTVFDKLLDLLEKPHILKSSANLEQLLTLLEGCVSPLSHLSKHSEEGVEVPQKDIDAAAAAGKEWMDVPRVIVSQERLQVLCSILRMETCRDASFTKVNTIVRRLCRVEANRGYVLEELASVARALGVDAIRDLKSLRIRMDGAVSQQKAHSQSPERTKEMASGEGQNKSRASRSASSAVTLSTSTSELKLLRVLQTLQALCVDSNEEQPGKKNESAVVTEELVQLLHAMTLGNLWDELSNCLNVVQILEGVSSFKDEEDQKSGENETDDASGDGGTSDAAAPGKKLKNSAAGLLTRFLPSIEAFFVACASSTRETPADKQKGELKEATDKVETGLEKLVEGDRVVAFVASNKVLLNALVRNNPGLLDKGLRSLVQVPRCRVYLDFDVKRQWFKTQVRRLRQHASRRHGSVRLHIRRKHVFEDAYHQLRLRNAEEMRGRLHITFRNEEGVDAGGLSREFFGILAKEMFNPNYALFTSTEDGCTFQPNAHSSMNPDHLSYFRFAGRIVGKAVADGFLLDAHFTRSLYKHILGLKPTHHDMEAIDPDYYRNLKTIIDFKLEDIGLDLTFSIEDNSFGRNSVIDLIPDGRNIAVTDERKKEYVSLVCQHRMTTAISSQIKSFEDGFYELVSPELIAIFNPRELELLISGLPSIDIDDLKKNTDYVGWKATDKEIEWFWNVMCALSRNEKAAFLQFVTGSSKVPLAGFSELQGMRGIQKFSIHKTSGPAGALASAHTCFNSLDLPTYKSEEELREKLLYAINEGIGAFLFA